MREPTQFVDERGTSYATLTSLFKTFTEEMHSLYLLSTTRVRKRMLVSLFSLALLFATWPQKVLASQDVKIPAQTAQAPPYTQQTPKQLQELVAPVALYPDSLVSQILAASTFPEQVVEADRWVQANPGLRGDALGQAVDQQPWDPSVKALTAFPSVLRTMDKNLSWTSSLGDAYYNQGQAVMEAIQTTRRQAQEAGNNVLARATTEYIPDSSWRKPNEQQEQTAGNPQWQVGTITAVQPYPAPASDPSATSYMVSLRVANVVYTVVHTPRPGTDIGEYAIGRALVVLIGDGTITYNDILGNSYEVPILSRTTVTAQGSW